jgi:predicted dehydrogenase
MYQKNTMKTIRWGIIGLGAIANDFASDLNRVSNTVIQGVASRSLTKAKDFAKKHKALKSYDSYEGLLGDSNVDVVYIATPHHLHLEWTLKAIKAKKAVLCEKPLGVNAHQVRQMMTAAKSEKVFLMEALWTRFNPTMEEVIDKLKSNPIGKLRLLKADFCFHALDQSPEHRIFNLELAGGSILDIGIYPVFLAYILFGKPQEIKAYSQFHQGGSELQTSVLLNYEDCQAQLFSSFAFKSEMKAHLYGEKGQLCIDADWFQSDSYRLLTGEGEQVYNHPKKGIGFCHEIEAVNTALRNSKIEEARWTLQNSLELIEILDEIRNQVGAVYDFE